MRFVGEWKWPFMLRKLLFLGFCLGFPFYLSLPIFALVYSVDMVIDKVGGETSLLDYPVGIALDEVQGRVFVSDWGGNRILVFGKDGQLLRKIPGLKNPAGIAVDHKRKRLLVAEQKANRVVIFDLDTLTLQGSLKVRKKPLSEPRGIWVAEDGTVYVADTGQSRIVVFGENGEEMFSFGREGMGDDEFYHPRGVALDPSGNLWVVDTLHHCVKVFDGHGRYLFRFGDGLNQPKYVTFFGNFAFLSDYRNHRVLVYDLAGKLQGSIGEEEQLFSFPEGLFIDGMGKLWVADAGNNRIVRIDLGYLVRPVEYLKVLLAEGRMQEFSRVFEHLSPEVKKNPEVGCLLFEFYRKKGDLEASISQAEELFLSDEKGRSEWKRVLGKLYAEKGYKLFEEGSAEGARDFFLRSFQYGRFASIFPYLFVSLLHGGGEYVWILVLLVLFGVLLLVYVRLRAEQERRWRRW
ncbi:MAG: NHL repeat-containing protein [Candidatus Caldatribacterium sp.]|nr:NHL repeat-containing protein [Candidatus Caldatribacterium sp.]